VVNMTITRHPGRFGKQDTVRVDYLCTGKKHYTIWLGFEHPRRSYPYIMAAKWWRLHCISGISVPSSIDNVLASTADLRRPASIKVRPGGKYAEIVQYHFEEKEWMTMNGLLAK
jgi:hypothetical protein